MLHKTEQGVRRALTQDQENLLEKLKRSGQSNADLARLFGVHRNTVRNILLRRARERRR